MKKYLKRLAALGIAIGVSAGSCSLAFAMPGTIGQWELVGTRWKYKLPDGSYLKPEGSDSPSSPLFMGVDLYPDGGMGFCGELSPFFYDENPLDYTGWRCDENGWWYVKDGSYLKDQWEEINGLWFYLGSDGYLLWDTTTPDGFQVNGQGQWVIDGVVQTRHIIYDQIPGFLEYKQHYNEMVEANCLARYGQELYDLFYANQPYAEALYDLTREELDWMMAHPDAQLVDGKVPY